MAPQLWHAASQHLRARVARDFVAARTAAERVLFVLPQPDVARPWLCGRSTFGWERSTPLGLAGLVAAPRLAAQGQVPIGGAAVDALVARVLARMREDGTLGAFEAVADAPTLAPAVARTLLELRLAGVAGAGHGLRSELALALAGYEAELEATGLADRASVLATATEQVVQGAASQILAIGAPLLVFDVSAEHTLEAAWIAALVEAAPEAKIVLPSGDLRTRTQLEAALGIRCECIEPGGETDPIPGELARLQRELFRDTSALPSEAAEPLDAEAGVRILSAPGESREAVEIARQILALAAQGVPFDRIAVLPRSPEDYRAHLEEAFARADVPFWLARGARRPDPDGRAFLALLACAAEGFSASRFAEYLSLGALPRVGAEGAPPAPVPRGERFVAPDEEVIGWRLQSDSAEPASDAEEVDDVALDGPALHSPRRFERLLVDAAVIGGPERWRRRLAGLSREFERAAAEISDDEARLAALERTRAELAALRAFALPLIDELAALPARADVGEWLDRLAALATRALRRPERVLAVLAELAPMAVLPEASLAELRLILAPRLRSAADPPPRSRYGRVFIGACDAVRGLDFDVVFVPGLAEKLFPRKILEDPILLDRERAPLVASGLRLELDAERVGRERLALQLAAGAARRSLVLSYPRLDTDRGRPRVPSFYALEALRAAEGVLPGFDELAARAEQVAEARIGWPAPHLPEQAIDEAEYDLALLEGLIDLRPEDAVGTARFLLDANPHLGRALRFRARRWLRRWTAADGLVDASDAAKQALAAHALGARSYSATALQHYSSCPYRFFLSAVHRLSPREVPEAIDELSPLQRGSLVHDVQFELFQRLERADLLPVLPGNLPLAHEQLDAVIDALAAEYREELAPAIERVWQDGIESVRADLREWLRRASEDESGFTPWRFELAFGLGQGSLSARDRADRHSTTEAVALDCGISLRGSIDLVERRSATTDGARDVPAALRITDHKTGKARVPKEAVVDGGQALQPVLYALAAEKLFDDIPVEAGRLYYCTSAGGFEDRETPLDEVARSAALELATTAGAALDEAFLPAAPRAGACRFCDYRVVCGPYEELRSARKPQAELLALESLRRLP